jgi:hypothetical protein
MNIRTRIDLDATLASEIFSAIGNVRSDDQHLQFFATRYQRSKANHCCSGYLHQGEPRAQQYDFTLQYYTEAAALGRLMDSIPENAPPVLDALQVLSELEAEYSFMCNTRFEYPKSRYGSRVGLPLSIPASPNLPWTEICGIRFAALEDDQRKYDMIVDHGLPEISVVAHMLDFAYMGEIALDLPQRILEKADEISTRFGAPY